MAEIQPFAALRFSLSEPEDAGSLVCPPYDVIGPAMRAELAARDEHNVVRLELPEPDAARGLDRYGAAARLLGEWLAGGVLRRDETPGLYLYGQEYAASGRRRTRLGILAALKVEPYEAGSVLPHEQTFPSHKEDRFRLLSSCGVQISPIFGLYAAPGAAVRERLEAAASARPAAVAVDADGVEHRLWPVADPGFVEWARQLLAERPVYIADGHHRYETALRYRDALRAAGRDPAAAGVVPGEYVMTLLVEMDDPGLILLPTHRMVAALRPGSFPAALERDGDFECLPWDGQEVEALGRHEFGVGVATPDGPRYHRVRLRSAAVLDRLESGSAAWRSLDVVLLHHVVLPLLTSEPEITYTRDAAEARDCLEKGETGAVFFEPSPSIADLKSVAGAGEKMPHKSTYFWPKAITGLTIFGEPGGP